MPFTASATLLPNKLSLAIVIAGLSPPFNHLIVHLYPEQSLLDAVTWALPKEGMD